MDLETPLILGNPENYNAKISRFFCIFMDFKIFPANFCISSNTTEDIWVSYAERSTIILHTHIRRHTHAHTHNIYLNYYYK